MTLPDRLVASRIRLSRPRWLAAYVLLSSSAAVSACDDSSGSSPVVDRVAVTPGLATLTAIGATVQLSATVLDADGNAISGVTVAWASANESVAAVSGSGLVTAVGNGSAAITATADGISASAAVTVAQQIAAVAVTPPVHTLVSIGESLQLSAQATDANGNAVSVASFTWSSSPQGIVQVSSLGRATAVSNGSATVTAAAGEIAGAASVVVDQAPARLQFRVQPSRTVADGVISPALEVGVADALGTVVEDATDAVTLAITTNPAGGSLGGATTVDAAMGVAVFDDLTIDRAGAGYTLTASSGALEGLTSDPFDIAPHPVTLDALTKTTNAITVDWSESAEPNFAFYAVLRSTDAQGAGVGLDTITDASTTVFEDSSAVLGQTYYYWVEVETADGVNSPSERAAIEAGIAIDLGTVVEKMLPDPARSMLYVISRNTNQLIFVDIGTNTVVKSMFIGMQPTDLDLDSTGDTLLVVSFSTNRVFVVDLAVLDTVRSFTFPVPGNHSQGTHYHIAAGRPGRAYYVDALWDPRVHVLDTGAGAELGVFNFEGVGDIEASADGNTLYVWRQYGWGAGVLNSWVTRIDASTDNLAVNQAGSMNIGRDPLDTPILLAASDSRVYTKRWAFRSADLDVIDAALPEEVYGVTPDGRLIFSETTIYDGTLGVPVRAMPLASRSMAVTADGSTLYIYEPGRGRIFVYDLTPF